MLQSPPQLSQVPLSQTAIVDSGATHIYIAPQAPTTNTNPMASTITVGVANGHVEQSAATADLTLPIRGNNFPTKGYTMPSFKHTLVCLGPI